jgi:hypothetical protein
MLAGLYRIQGLALVGDDEERIVIEEVQQNGEKVASAASG